MSAETEKKLNQMGVFDDEINAMSDEQINRINNSYNCSVAINYYEEDEDGTYTDMNPSEIDAVIDEKYGKEIKENKNNTKIKKILDKTIFGAATVDAAKTQAVTKESSSGAMKQILWCTQYSKGGNVKVTYSCTWLKRPKYRGVDVIGINIKDATTISNSSSLTHMCEYMPGLTYETWTDSKKTPARTTSNGIAYTFKMYDFEGANIKNERVIMEMTCSLKSQSTKVVSAWGTYIHAKKNSSSVPQVNVSSDQITVPDSAYQTITNNPCLNFTTK